LKGLVWLKFADEASEGLDMQKYPDNLSEDDRRIARRWTLASVGFYGSILAGFILYAAFHQSQVPNLATGDPASKVLAANSPQQLASKKLPR
jgi:hypothetical protein